MIRFYQATHSFYCGVDCTPGPCMFASRSANSSDFRNCRVGPAQTPIGSPVFSDSRLGREITSAEPSIDVWRVAPGQSATSADVEKLVAVKRP